jgi:hypothetical protein
MDQQPSPTRRSHLSTVVVIVVAAVLLYLNLTPVVQLQYEQVYGFPVFTYFSHPIEVGDSDALMMLAPAGWKFEGILANVAFVFAALHLAAKACALLKRRAQRSLPEMRHASSTNLTAPFQNPAGKLQ